MTRLPGSFLCLSLLLASLFSGKVQAEVKILNQSNFYATLANPPAKQWFVKFYAQWCGHCKRLSPIWDELSEAVDDKTVGIAKVDATKNRDLADKFGVRGYPTLIFIPDDKTYTKYSAGRNLEELLSFVQGGYKESPLEKLPSPPGWEEIIKSYKKRLNKEYLMLEEDFHHILAVRKNAMVAFLLIGAALGGLLGLMCGACCCRGTRSSAKKNKIE